MHILNLITVLGALLVIIGALFFIVPPKFSDSWYGIKTPQTLKNEEIWLYAHKRYSIAIVVTGCLIGVLGLMSLKMMILKISGVVILSAAWLITKGVVEKMIIKKYPDID